MVNILAIDYNYIRGGKVVMHYLKKIKNFDLEQFNHGVEEYHMSWKAVDQYAYDVLTGKIPTGKQIKYATARYIHDRVARKDLEFRTNEVDELCQFTNLLRHVKGPLNGKSIELMNWMVFVLGNIFGWYHNDGDKKGKRRFTKAFTLVARGNAKSFLCSIVALWTQLTSPNGSPACYSVARQRDQARIVFDDASKMLRNADPILRRWFKPKSHDMECVFQDGTFKPMSSDSQSLDGHRVSLGIADELHAHHSGELLNTLLSGTTAVNDPLVFSISTAGKQLEGICVSERNVVRAINEGFENEDSYFGVEYAVDDGDEWDDESVWFKANPSLGHAVSIDDLRGKIVRAKSSAANRVDFQTKHCNLFVNTNDNPYLDVLELQQKCSNDGLKISDYVGKELFIGLDLAQKTDLTALSFLFPEEDGSLTAFFRHYIPEGALEKVSAGRYEMYQEWEEDGHLVITPGFSTDYTYIEQQIRWAAKHFDLQQVGFDPYAGTQLALGLIKDNIDMVEVRQGYASLSEPAKLFESLVASSQFKYQGTDKVFEWCASNAVCSADLNENIKVHKAKDKPHDKVDSVVALITGLALAKLKEPVKKSPYRKRGLITL